MKIEAREIHLAETTSLKPNPKNRNSHPPEQIERLVELIKYQGFRQPIIVSNRTGLMVTGHGRREAALKMGLEKVPVVFQDFADEAQEYAFGVSDNAIASWSLLDLAAINSDILDLGPDFSLDFLGIKGFELEPADKDPNNSSSELDLNGFDNFEHNCPKCGFGWNNV